MNEVTLHSFHSELEKIAVGKELEMFGHLLRRTRFDRSGDKLVSVGRGAQKRVQNALLKELGGPVPAGKMLSETNKKRAANVTANFLADPTAYAVGVGVPVAATGAYIPGAGAAYVLAREALINRLSAPTAKDIVKRQRKAAKRLARLIKGRKDAV